MLNGLSGLSGLSGIFGNAAFTSLLQIPSIVVAYDARTGCYADAAAQFTAASLQYLNKTSNSSLQTGGTSFSYAGWVYLDTKVTLQLLWNKWTAAGQNEAQVYYNNGTDRLVFDISIDGTAVATSVVANNFGSISTATWYFVVTTFDSGTNTLSIGVNNGTPNTAISAGGTTSRTSQFAIGSYGATPAFYLNGRIDSLGFWKKVLSASEITSLYNSGNGLVFSGVTGSLLTSLISWWDLSESDGVRYDSFGTNHLTDNNIVTQIQGIAASACIDENFAAGFTSTSSQYLSVADNATLRVADIDFSFAAWVYLSTLGSERYILGKYDVNIPSLEYLLYIKTDNKFHFLVDDGITGNIVDSTATAVVANTWHLVVGWHDSTLNTINIQVDGGTVNTKAHTAIATTGTAGFRISSQPLINGFWNGRIDGVGFWKGHVLDATERTTLFNNGKGLKYAGLATGGITTPTSFWNLDEATNATRSDSVGTNHLTSNNGVTRVQGVDFAAGAIARLVDSSSNILTLTKATISGRPAFDAINKFAVFDGVDDNLQRPSNDAIIDFETTNPFSGFALFKTPSIATTAKILTHSLDSGAGGWQMYTSSSKMRFDIRGATGLWRVIGNTVMTSNTLYSLIYVYDGSGSINGMNIYLNGVLDTSQSTNTLTGSSQCSQKLTIGNIGDLGATSLNGSIKVAGVSNTAYTAAQIATLNTFLLGL